MAALTIVMFTACKEGSGGDDPTTITHNGTTYGFVTSPYTGKVWLDRNLGAARVCEQFDDDACYGDYYQWGRNFDGHEDSLSASVDVSAASQAADVSNVGHGNFIESNSTYDYDWAKAADSNGSIRQANWSATDGSSVCPVGFRVPTIVELRAELLDTGSAQIGGDTPSTDKRENAFASFLKLPSAGYRRSNLNGTMYGVGSWGRVWSSSASGSDASLLGFLSNDAASGSTERAHGLSVRCLRD